MKGLMGEYFDNLPEEITLDILSRLPTESVLECKSVCKTWNNLVSHHLNEPFPDNADSGKLGFIAQIKDGNFQYFEYNDVNLELAAPIERISRFNFNSPIKNYCIFVGSFNGLICLAGFRSVCICNPITREYVMLPKIKTDINGAYWKYGFGYVSSTNEYKVIGLSGSMNNQVPEIHIYTLGSGVGWRNLGNFNPEFGMDDWDQAVCANEAVYWISRKLRDRISGELGMIVKFDLAEEKFCKCLSPPPLPPLAPYHGGWHSAIGVLDGFLFFAIYLALERIRSWCDVWLLRKKNDTREQETHQSLVWSSKEFRVPDSIFITLTRSQGVLISIDNHLNVHDTKTSTSKRLVKLKERICKVFRHKNTLVSLKQLGEEDCKTMESVEDTRYHDHIILKQL